MSVFHKIKLNTGMLHQVYCVLWFTYPTWFTYGSLNVNLRTIPLINIYPEFQMPTGMLFYMFGIRWFTYLTWFTYGPELHWYVNVGTVFFLCVQLDFVKKPSGWLCFFRFHSYSQQNSNSIESISKFRSWIVLREKINVLPMVKYISTF